MKFSLIHKMIARKCNLQAIWEIEESMFMKILWATNMPWINVPLERNKKLLGKFDFFFTGICLCTRAQTKFIHEFFYFFRKFVNEFFLRKIVVGMKLKEKNSTPLKRNYEWIFYFFIVECSSAKILSFLLKKF